VRARRRHDRRMGRCVARGVRRVSRADRRRRSGFRRRLGADRATLPRTGAGGAAGPQPARADRQAGPRRPQQRRRSKSRYAHATRAWT
jgi:hypothetical protein